MEASEDPTVAARARHLATQAREPTPHYEHVEIGFNYRMSKLLAAVGRGQLATLDRKAARRRLIADRHREQLGVLPGVHLHPGERRTVSSTRGSPA